MEKHWQDEDWHKFYAEHLNLEPVDQVGLIRPANKVKRRD